MNKKFISAIMAGAMAISTLGFSAFAADPDAFTVSTDKGAAYGGKAQSYKVSTSLAAPDLKVTLPTSMGAVINPYGIKATVGKDTAGTDGIISPVYAIINKSAEMAVTVTATATVTVADGITVVDEAIEEDSKEAGKFAAKSADKEVFAELCASSSKAKAPDTVNKGIVFIVEDEDTEATPTKVMDIVGVDTTNKDGGVGYIQIKGTVSTHDKDGKAQTWTSADKVNLVLVLDITPSKATATKVDGET